MSWRFIGVVASLVAAVGVGGGLLWAAEWLDTQTSSGNVTVSSTTTDILYICEPTGTGGSPPCVGDDSAGDEIIFEFDEALLPGGPAVSWNILLWNPSPDVVADITGIEPTFTETLDPGNDCADEPSLLIMTVTYDDDHDLGFGGAILPQVYADDYPTRRYVVHLSQESTDEMRIQVSLGGDFPGECQGNAWDLTIDWTAEIH